MERQGVKSIEALLRQCVHCGFCNATCPTYQLLGDELDGPRGRIYLIKQALAGDPVTRSTQQHLDRCLSCRNCETTCPSGVSYAQLLETGRALVNKNVERPWWERLLMRLISRGLRSRLFALMLGLARLMRPLAPIALKRRIPHRPIPIKNRSYIAMRKPPNSRVLIPTGCVQGHLSPNIHQATRRVLDALSMQIVDDAPSTCCGALPWHLADEQSALDTMRANIDRWYALLEQKTIDVILSNASGCGLMIKDYGHVFANDVAYAHKAAKIASACVDIAEFCLTWIELLKAHVSANQHKNLIFHPPCTLQHGQRVVGVTEQVLLQLGIPFRLAQRESYLCCGSAGVYSLLHPKISKRLRQRKLQALAPNKGEIIVSSNIGCITHLQVGTDTPVLHWIEYIEQLLLPPSPNASI